mmetsp:Transcript_69165/g.129973  ORF Transcript_69165/g.129973 Transcript_69165/m.129973 type:complete len:272 (-) Transcript_69165:291-1106(-)
MRTSFSRGFFMLARARRTDDCPAGLRLSMVSGSSTASTWRLVLSSVLQRSRSPFTASLPAWSSMWREPFSFRTRDTRMGVSEPSSCSIPFVKLAAVFITRPSSEVLILRSCRNVEWSLRTPPLEGSGYNFFRSVSPSNCACASPSGVRAPPHLRMSCSLVARGAAEAPPAAADPDPTSAHSTALIWSLRVTPLMRPFPSTSLICCSLYTTSSRYDKLRPRPALSAAAHTAGEGKAAAAPPPPPPPAPESVLEELCFRICFRFWRRLSFSPS